MGLTLADLGATAFIGFGVVLGSVFLARFLLPDWDLPRPDLPESKLAIPIVSLACFGVGIIFEDLSWKYADHDIAFFVPFVVPNDDELKVQALLGDSCANSLGRQVGAVKGLSTWPRGLPQDTRRKAEALERKLSAKDRIEYGNTSNHIDAVIPAYFQAKNACYQNSNYRSVLTEIQRRIDFARSCSVLCLLLLTLIALAALIRIAIDSRHAGRISIEKALVHRSLKAALVIALICVAAAKAYEQEELRHNRRVFGFYLTMTGPKQTASSNKEARVERIRFESPKRYAKREFSGLAWLPGESELVLLEQGQTNKHQIPNGTLHCIKKSALVESIRLGRPLPETSIREVQIDAQRIRGSLPSGYEFDGFESIAYAPDGLAWLTIECEPKDSWPGGSIGLLCRGRHSREGRSLVIERVAELLPAQTTVGNMAYEATVVACERAFALHESNGVIKRPQAIGNRRETGIERHSAEFPRIPYRTTDATSVRDGAFWIINYMFPGDEGLRTSVDPFAGRQTRGSTHQESANLGSNKQVVERLIEVLVSDNPPRFTPGRVLQLQLSRDAKRDFVARNWEGIAWIEAPSGPSGFILITDDNGGKHKQELILAYVPHVG